MPPDTAADGDLWPAVIVAIFFVVYQQLENYLLVPRVGPAATAHPTAPADAAPAGPAVPARREPDAASD